MPGASRRYWAATHRGAIRISNEDRYLVLHHASTQNEESICGDLPDAGWAAIADGMGGHQAGELASKLAIEAISKPIPDVVTESAAIEMLHEANRSIFQAMRAGIGRPAMGTTLVGASIRSDRCVIFNIGDSRAYLLRTQVLRQVSKDHVPQVETGRRRSHAVTQALGGLRTEGPISPHTHSFTLDPDDTILLCSDGLTDMISDDEITAVLKSSKSDPAKDLVEAALEAGGHDNITVVVIRPH